MSTVQSPQPRDHNNDNDALIDIAEAQASAANGQHSTIDGWLIEESYKDDPSLSENVLMIIVISVCCFIAIVIIFIIIGFCYTKRPSASEIFGSSAYEIHSSNSLPLTSIPESTGETSM